VHPSPVSLTETIASSARVGGIKESAVGAQFSGTVEQLFVKAGDRVKAGQALGGGQTILTVGAVAAGVIVIIFLTALISGCGRS
jgi:multidrug efflux pump subunit AcrA (membrane-fusion protein)